MRRKVVEKAWLLKYHIGYNILRISHLNNNFFFIFIRSKNVIDVDEIEENIVEEDHMKR